MRERIKWIDVAKFFGIFAIYLGHFGPAAGYGYDFVFRYHIPLFFLISGCIATFNRETNITKYLIKRVKDILLPFWIFALASIIVFILADSIGPTIIADMFEVVAMGAIRNKFVAGSLWFLTCLFVIELMFAFIKRLNNKPAIVGVCLILRILSERILDPSPIVNPSGFYNYDSALYYIIFYAVGYTCFPAIVELFKLDTHKKNIVFGVSGLASLVYSAYAFVGIDFLAPLHAIPIVAVFSYMISTLIIIWSWFVISKLCENVDIFVKIGRQTLYLCGSEYIIKAIITGGASILGLAVTINTPIATFIYTSILLVLVYKYLVPVERRIVESVKKFFENLFTCAYAKLK